MTICAVWRENGEIKFAADSRVSFKGKSKPFDKAIKISPVRMEVDLVNPVCLSDEEYFYGNIGLCFAGSVVSSFVLKDTLLQALNGWVILDWRNIPPFSSYIEIAFKNYEAICREVCDSLIGQEGLATIALAGYCFKNNRYEAYLFEPNKSTGNFSFREVTTSEGDFIFFGSAKNLANGIFEKKNVRFSTHAAIDVIREIIDKQLDSSVGGHIQTGSFDKKHSFITTIQHVIRQ